MTDRTSSKNAEGMFEPFSAEEVPWEEFSRGRFGSRWRALSRFGGGSHVGVALEELSPGMVSNQLHYHMLEEEHVFILEGSLTVRLGDARHVMNAGDYVCFPAGQKVGHCLVNHTDQPCRYIMIGESNPNEVSVYPETGRVGVRLLGEGYRNRPMDYWEGVEGA